MPEGDSCEHKVCKTYQSISVKIPILYPLKIPEHERFSGVFMGYEIGQSIASMDQVKFVKDGLQKI